jgi:hypothetical protein
MGHRPSQAGSEPSFVSSTFIGGTHPATAQLLDDAVMRDNLANHWAQMLGLEVRQVNEAREVGGPSSRQLIS